MVLMHKLRQSEQVDLAHFHKSKDEDVDPIVAQPLQRPASPPHRPQTRSQSGRPAKRRVRQDNALDPATSNTSPPKKPRLAQQKRNTNGVSKPKEPTPPKDVKFIQADPSNQGVPSNRPGPRTRITIPVPVPNLTKKSRGRRVPTTNAERASSAGQTRKYVCTVAECGKCFHRGEHLKRHIRSIHTNEKPFKCPALDCNKTFNRHDNLLQHVKIHAPGKPDEDGRVAGKRKPYATSSLSSLGSVSTGVTVSDNVEAEEGREDVEDEDDEEEDAEGDVDEDRTEDGAKAVVAEGAALRQQQQQQSSYMVMVPYGIPTGDAEQSAVGYNVGATVSSLRTEMPDVEGGGARANEGAVVPSLSPSLMDALTVEAGSIPSATPPEVIYQLMDIIEGMRRIMDTLAPRSIPVPKKETSRIQRAQNGLLH